MVKPNLITLKTLIDSLYDMAGGSDEDLIFDEYDDKGKGTLMWAAYHLRILYNNELNSKKYKLITALIISTIVLIAALVALVR